MKVTTTRNWWGGFCQEYDRGDHDWFFDRVKETYQGHRVTLDIDETFVVTKEVDVNNVSETPARWFRMIVSSDADPFGWVMDTYEEKDRRDKARARAYVTGCKNIIAQL